MVFYIEEGNIFKVSNIRNYAHGCNCAGAMGKGIALQFRNKFPELYKQYKKLCATKEFSPGDVFKYDYSDGTIYNLGTQKTWREKAQLKYIKQSLNLMLDMACVDNVGEIVMPAIGAGLGGMDWNEIKLLINEVANSFPSVNLYVVEQYKDIYTDILYIKKKWEEDGTIYFLHFVGAEAMRQIEINSEGVIRLSVEAPTYKDYFLCDQSLEMLSISPSDYITKEEFERVWTS